MNELKRVIELMKVKEQSNDFVFRWKVNSRMGMILIHMKDFNGLGKKLALTRSKVKYSTDQILLLDIEFALKEIKMARKKLEMSHVPQTS